MDGSRSSPNAIAANWRLMTCHSCCEELRDILCDAPEILSELSLRASAIKDIPNLLRRIGELKLNLFRYRPQFVGRAVLDDLGGDMPNSRSWLGGRVDKPPRRCNARIDVLI